MKDIESLLRAETQCIKEVSVVDRLRLVTPDRTSFVSAGLRGVILGGLTYDAGSLGFTEPSTSFDEVLFFITAMSFQ
jgi:hypothetical protein